jgi:hypothetical protein
VTGGSRHGILPAALRERTGDILLLAHRFAARLAAQFRKQKWDVAPTYPEDVGNYLGPGPMGGLPVSTRARAFNRARAVGPIWASGRIWHAAFRSAAARGMP